MGAMTDDEFYDQLAIWEMAALNCDVPINHIEAAQARLYGWLDTGSETREEGLARHEAELKNLCANIGRDNWDDAVSEGGGGHECPTGKKIAVVVGVTVVATAAVVGGVSYAVWR